MKKLFSNAKTVFKKLRMSISCWWQINLAVVRYLRAEAKFNKLHPVRDAREREIVGHKLRLNEVAYEVAVSKLNLSNRSA